MLILVTVMGCWSGWTQNTIIQGIEYKIIGASSVEIVQPNDKTASTYSIYKFIDIVVPDPSNPNNQHKETFYVTSIGDGAFEGCANLEKIDLPSGITRIGARAFKDCKKLINVTIPYSITYIGDQAFQSCEALSMTMPPNVIHIGVGVFEGIQKLTVNNLSAIETIGDNAFAASTLIGDVNISSTKLTKIGTYFQGSNIESVILADNITDIAPMAFKGCWKLRSATLPLQLKTIEASVFENTDLATIKIPDKVEEIKEKAFTGCNQLKKVELGGKLKIIGESAFANNAVEEVIFSNRVEQIGKNAFAGTRLTSLDIPDNVKTIGDGAFNRCGSLQSVRLPNQLTKISATLFWGCLSLKTIDIPKSVQKIGVQSFFGCAELSSIKIPDGVTDIEHGTFDGCADLASITIPNSVQTIVMTAFNGTSLSSILIPEKINYVGSNNIDVFTNKIKKVYIKKTTPPQSDNKDYFPEADCFLYVSRGCKEVFIGWAGFDKDHIIEDEQFEVDYILTGLTTDGPSIVFKNDPLSFTLFPINGKELPESILISMGSVVQEEVVDYTYNEENGEVYLLSAEGVIGDIRVKASHKGSGGSIAVSEFSDKDFTYTVTGEKTVKVKCPKNRTLNTYSIPRSARYAWIEDANGNETEGFMTFSVTGIGKEAFKDCPNLTYVSIPQYITTIGSSAFSGCSKLTKVQSTNPTPPIIDETVFLGINKELSILYIPKGTKEQYLAAGWTGFTHIQEEGTEANDLRITSLPEKVVFGVESIKLLSNVDKATFAIKGGTSDVASITDATILNILKPGTVTITISVPKDGNGGNDTYDQELTVEKRLIVLTGGLVAYGDVYDGSDTVKVNIISDGIKFSGLKGGSTLKIGNSGVLEGKMVDANAGTNKAVTITTAITLSPDSSAWYELAPVAFVTTNIAKKELTVTAAAVNNATREYGKANPVFSATYSGFVTVGSTPETEAALEGMLKFDCAATPTSLAGTYNVAPYGLTAKNYALTFKTCALTVTTVNPTIETVGAIVNKDKTISMTGKIVDNGGVAGLVSADSVVSFMIKKPGDQAVVEQTVNVVRTGNIFTYKLATNATTGTYTIQAKAKIGKSGRSKEGTGKDISVVIDAKKAQTVSFESNISKLVYGSTATLVGKSDESAAKGAYTYSVMEGGAALVINATTGVLTTKGAGKATIKVSRATDTDYSAAEAYITIEVISKPVSAKLINLDKLTKTYDGTTSLATQPVYTLADGAKVGTDVVSVATVSGARFADKNAVNQKLLLPELILTGAAAANYTLMQPFAPTVSISQQPLTVKVNDIVRNYNDLYTDYTFTWKGFVTGEESLPGLYTGTLKVKEATVFTDNVSEKSGQLGLDIIGVKFANYALSAAEEQGALVIKRGNPIGIVYNAGTGIGTLLVDDAGYGRDNLAITATSGEFAQIILNGGALVGQTLNKITTTSANRLKATKAADDWNNQNAQGVGYGSEVTIITETGFTYEATDKLLLVKTETNSLTYKANNVGGAAVIATKTDGTVKFMYYNITAKEVNAILTTAYSKGYDGTALASGLQVMLEGTITDDIALNTTDISFNFASKNVVANGIISPSKPLTLMGSQRNNYILKYNLTGTVNKANLKITSPISKYYDGTTTVVVSDYATTGRAEGEIVPVTVTFADAKTGTGKTITAVVSDANYELQTVTVTGSILKSTMLATLQNAPSKAEAINRARFTLVETGASGIKLADYAPEVTQIGSVYHVSGGDTENYTIVYVVTKADNVNDPVTPPSSGTVSVESVSLDLATKTIARLVSFTLKATINPDNATNKNVTWKSSDDKIATVDANGKVTGVKVGKATITVTTEDGSETATCEVTVDVAAGLEGVIADTQVYGANGQICILPAAPMQARVVNMTGVIIYNAMISSETLIPAGQGVYIVRLGSGANTATHKVNVR